MTEVTRTTTGVVFESDVLSYIHRLAAERGRSRSFIINQIIRIYSRLAAGEALPGAAPEQVPRDIVPEKRISF